MKRAIAPSIFLVAFLLLALIPLESPAQAATGSSLTVHFVGQTAAGSIDENNTHGVVLFDVNQTGFYEVNITATNNYTASYTTPDVSISLNSRTSTYDPINNRLTEQLRPIYMEMDARNSDFISDIEPLTSEWSVWTVPVVDPKIISIMLELTSGKAVNYEIIVTRLANLDENQINLGNNVIDWNDSEFGKLLYFDVPSPSIYNISIDQNITTYNVSDGGYIGASLRMRVSGFNASEDQLEVIFNDQILGYIKGDETFWEISPNTITHDVVDGNNITLVYTNFTVGAQLSIIEAYLYIPVEDGDRRQFWFPNFLATMEWGSNVSSDTDTVDSYTVPGTQDQDDYYSLTHGNYGYEVSNPIDLVNNVSDWRTPYLASGRYYLNMSREFRAQKEISISIAELPTQNLTAGNSLKFTYAKGNQTSAIPLNLSSANYVVVNLPEGRYDKLSLLITSGMNWTVYGLPIIQGSPLIPTLVYQKYDNLTTPVSYQELSSVNIISREFIPSHSQWATGETFNTHEVLPVSLIDTNGSLSIGTSLFGLFSNMPNSVLTFAIGAQESLGYTATATVSFNLTLTDLHLTSLQSPTFTTPVFNATVGNIMDIFSLEVAIGNEYIITAEPLAWTSHGYVSLQVTSHTGEDWLHWYLPTYIGPCTMTTAAVNESTLIEYVPVRDGKVYIMVMGYDTVSTLGDTSSIRVNITSEVEQVTVGAGVGNTITFSQDDNVTLLAFTAIEGHTYTIGFFSEEGMVDPFCGISFFDARGINQFSTVLSGYIEFYGTSASTVTFVARSTGPVYIAVYGRVTFGTATVTVILTATPPPNLFLGLAIGIPAGIAVGAVIFWALMKKGILLKKEP
ncbi:MAG: hypothetical protein ACFE7E_02010 [Candidatus Hodarchaeota archaeon]